MAAVTGPASATPGRGRGDRGDRRHRPVSSHPALAALIVAALAAL